MLPSLFVSGGNVQAWSVIRAAAYGAGIGALAALFKTLGPLREAGVLAAGAAGTLTADCFEIAGAVVGFALLCAGAAALRNFLARRLVWPQTR